MTNGLEPCIARAVAYAPHADLIWCETSKPDLDQAKQFAEGVRRHHPDKLLAYNCSPSFNWKKNLDDATIARFQRELGAMGYKFQFITLAGFHQLNFGMFELARGYRDAADGGLFGAAGGGVRRRGQRLHRHKTSARGRHRLFRRGVDGDQRRPLVDHGDARIDRARTVPAGGGIRTSHSGEDQRSTTDMPPRTRVKERAEEQASAMSKDQQTAIRMLANDLHRLNQSVMKAVEAGVSVELVRSARHHGGDGNWGDLLVPVIVTQGGS